MLVLEGLIEQVSRLFEQINGLKTGFYFAQKIIFPTDDMEMSLFLV